MQARRSLEEVVMKTNETSREQISALADGELSEQHVDIALAGMRQSDARADWELYHQIGDILRSDEMAVTLSSGFAAKMAARLDAEPTIIAPLPSTIEAAAAVVDKTSARSLKRWAAPSIAAAAAMATVAFVTTPQLMVALKDDRVPEQEIARVAAVASSSEQENVSVASAPEGVVLRDPRIDDYLLAHQRFSPSVYSTAQYARSATFASDSGK